MIMFSDEFLAASDEAIDQIAGDWLVDHQNATDAEWESVVDDLFETYLMR